MKTYRHLLANSRRIAKLMKRRGAGRFPRHSPRNVQVGFMLEMDASSSAAFTIVAVAAEEGKPAHHLPWQVEEYD